MTKADIVNEVVKSTGVDKVAVLNIIEAFMGAIKNSLAKEKNVYLRGFGSFVIKKRAQKTARDISKNTAMIIPAHNIPAFKPARSFAELLKK
jgi:DNA-binding protein HU-beta